MVLCALKQSVVRALFICSLLFLGGSGNCWADQTCDFGERDRPPLEFEERESRDRNASVQVHEYYLQLRNILENSFYEKKIFLAKITELENKLNGLYLEGDALELRRILGEIKLAVSAVAPAENGKLLFGVEYLINKVKTLEKEAVSRPKKSKAKVLLTAAAVIIGIAGVAGLVWFFISQEKKRKLRMHEQQEAESAALKQELEAAAKLRIAQVDRRVAQAATRALEQQHRESQARASRLESELASGAGGFRVQREDFERRLAGLESEKSQAEQANVSEKVRYEALERVLQDRDRGFAADTEKLRHENEQAGLRVKELIEELSKVKNSLGAVETFGEKAEFERREAKLKRELVTLRKNLAKETQRACRHAATTCGYGERISALQKANKRLRAEQENLTVPFRKVVDEFTREQQSLQQAQARVLEKLAEASASAQSKQEEILAVRKIIEEQKTRLREQRKLLDSYRDTIAGVRDETRRLTQSKAEIERKIRVGLWHVKQRQEQLRAGQARIEASLKDNWGIIMSSHERARLAGAETALEKKRQEYLILGNDYLGQRVEDLLKQIAAKDREIEAGKKTLEERDSLAREVKKQRAAIALKDRNIARLQQALADEGDFDDEQLRALNARLSLGVYGAGDEYDAADSLDSSSDDPSDDPSDE